MNEFWQNLLTSLTDFVARAGLRIAGAILVLIVGVKLIRWVLRLVNRGKKFQSLPANVRALADSLLRVALYVLLAVTVATMIGVEMTSITAAIASAGLAIGLALQGSLANFAGGIMILIFHPFSIGDYIDDGTHAGTVTDIGIFYTVMETPDNRVVTIPNGVLSNSAVTDFSVRETRRLEIHVGVAYDSDPEEVRAALTDLAMAHPAVLRSPEPAVLLGEHGESALVFYLRVWVRSGDYWTVNFELLEGIRGALERRGIKIPFRQVEVHLEREE